MKGDRDRSRHSGFSRNADQTASDDEPRMEALMRGRTTTIRKSPKTSDAMQCNHRSLNEFRIIRPIHRRSS